MDFQPTFVCVWLPWYVRAALFAILVWPLVGLFVLRLRRWASVDPVAAHLLLLWPVTVGSGVGWHYFADVLGWVERVESQEPLQLASRRRMPPWH